MSATGLTRLLRIEGVWQLAGPAEITSCPPVATPTITELRQGRVAGGFAEPMRLTLARDPALAAEIARRILNAHFPESIRQDVADAVGLCLDADSAATLEQSQRRRDPAFREKVLLAYEYRCCVCGHDLRMGGHEWVATSGPRSRAHQVVSGARAGRAANGPRALFAASQDLRLRRVHRAAGEPPDRVQPPPPR